MKIVSEIRSSTSGNMPENWPLLVRNSVQDVFSVMVGGAVVATPVAARNKDYCAMIGLAGALRGVLSLTAPADTAQLIARSMLSSETVDSNSVMDALGEICNMVAGDFKRRIPKIADACLLSVPTVIAGADYQLHSLVDASRTHFGFQFKGHDFSVVLQVSASPDAL